MNDDYFSSDNMETRRSHSQYLGVYGVCCPKKCGRFVSVEVCKDCRHLTYIDQRGYKIQCDYEYWYKNVYLPSLKTEEKE